MRMYRQESFFTNAIVADLGEEKIKELALSNLDGFAARDGYIREPEGKLDIHRLQPPFISEEQAEELKRQGLQAWVAVASLRPMTPEEDKQNV